MSKTHKIFATIARRLALASQLLDGRTKVPSGKEGVARTIEELGYVQVDTISVIQRAHHHTLWTRLARYNPDHLLELQAKDRRVFEYWGHALSYLPMADYRFCLYRMERFRDPQLKWDKERLRRFGHYMPPVLKRITEEGPLTSRQIGELHRRGEKTPPERNAFRVAAEILFWQGDLMISERRGIERVYDLTERVLPASVDTSPPGYEELGRFQIRRALNAYGLAMESEIRSHIQNADTEILKRSLEAMEAEGLVSKVSLEGKNNGDYYALPETLERASAMRKTRPRLHLLSPFDNLIIQRDRLRRLFDFDYTLECYVPPAKRKHGYYVLPILWGEQFIGRLDPKVDRKTNTLAIKTIQLEPSVSVDGAWLRPLAQKLWDLARFNECRQISVDKASPTAFATILSRALADISG